METRHIAFIETVARKGSISAAAAEIGLTQPALTKIVARLEDELGARLFERRARGVVPTPFGQLFLERLAPVSHSLDTLAREVRAMRAGLSGAVSVGIGQFWVARIFPGVAAEATRAMPDVQMRVVTAARGDLVRALRRGELDMVLASIVGEPPADIEQRPLLEVALFLMVRAGHPLAALDRPVRPEDLDGARWVLPPAADPSVTYLNGAMAARGRPAPTVAVEAVSHNFAVGMLQATDLVSALPDIGRSAFRQGLVKLRADWLSWRRTAGILLPRDRSVLPAVERLAAMLERHVRASRGEAEGLADQAGAGV